MKYVVDCKKMSKPDIVNFEVIYHILELLLNYHPDNKSEQLFSYYDIFANLNSVNLKILI